MNSLTASMDQIVQHLRAKGLVDPSQMSLAVSIDRTRQLVAKGLIATTRAYTAPQVSEITSYCLLPSEAFMATLVPRSEHPERKMLSESAYEAMAWKVNPRWWTLRGNVLTHPADTQGP
jgi:hypothetical protein